MFATAAPAAMPREDALPAGRRLWAARRDAGAAEHCLLATARRPDMMPPKREHAAAFIRPARARCGLLFWSFAPSGVTCLWMGTISARPMMRENESESTHPPLSSVLTPLGGCRRPTPPESFDGSSRKRGSGCCAQRGEPPRGTEGARPQPACGPRLQRAARAQGPHRRGWQQLSLPGRGE